MIYFLLVIKMLLSLFIQDCEGTLAFLFGGTSADPLPSSDSVFDFTFDLTFGNPPVFDLSFDLSFE